jgi:hypothetical protein
MTSWHGKQLERRKTLAIVGDDISVFFHSTPTNTPRGIRTPDMMHMMNGAFSPDTRSAISISRETVIAKARLQLVASVLSMINTQLPPLPLLSPAGNATTAQTPCTDPHTPNSDRRSRAKIPGSWRTPLSKKPSTLAAVLSGNNHWLIVLTVAPQSSCVRQRGSAKVNFKGRPRVPRRFRSPPPPHVAR